MSDDAIDETVRAFVLDGMARQAAAERDRVMAGLRLLARAVLVGLAAGIAGGCTAWLVLR